MAEIIRNDKWGRLSLTPVTGVQIPVGSPLALFPPSPLKYSGPLGKCPLANSDNCCKKIAIPGT